MTDTQRVTQRVDIKLFNGTQPQAQGLIRVMGEAFDGCPFSAQDLVSMHADGSQQTWVALREGEVVGFASAFPTSSLSGERWEVDLLAVLAAARGQGLGTALVARCDAQRLERLGRALVEKDNVASQRAFEKNSYRSWKRVDLLVYEISGRAPRPRLSGPWAVRAAQPADAPDIARLSGCAKARAKRLLDRGQNQYLVVEQNGRIAGYVELVPVTTLQYRGLWLDSFAVDEGDDDCARVLVRAAIEHAKQDERLDEIGCLAPSGAEAIHAACVGEGFRQIGEYDSWIREPAHA